MLPLNVTPIQNIDWTMRKTLRLICNQLLIAIIHVYILITCFFKCLIQTWNWRERVDPYHTDFSHLPVFLKMFQTNIDVMRITQCSSLVPSLWFLNHDKVLLLPFLASFWTSWVKSLKPKVFEHCQSLSSHGSEVHLFPQADLHSTSPEPSTGRVTIPKLPPTSHSEMQNPPKFRKGKKGIRRRRKKMLAKLLLDRARVMQEREHI